MTHKIDSKLIVMNKDIENVINNLVGRQLFNTWIIMSIDLTWIVKNEGLKVVFNILNTTTNKFSIYQRIIDKFVYYICFKQCKYTDTEKFLAIIMLETSAISKNTDNYIYYDLKS